ncbi:MAG: hypothetical protein U0271_39225 [Polyangiaceae bacterium]
MKQINLVAGLLGSLLVACSGCSSNATSSSTSSKASGKSSAGAPNPAVLQIALSSLEDPDLAAKQKPVLEGWLKKPASNIAVTAKDFEGKTPVKVTLSLPEGFKLNEQTNDAMLADDAVEALATVTVTVSLFESADSVKKGWEGEGAKVTKAEGTDNSHTVTAVFPGWLKGVRDETRWRGGCDEMLCDHRRKVRRRQPGRVPALARKNVCFNDGRGRRKRRLAAVTRASTKASSRDQEPVAALEPLPHCLERWRALKKSIATPSARWFNVTPYPSPARTRPGPQ